MNVDANTYGSRLPPRFVLAATATALLTALTLAWATLMRGIAGPENHPANNIVFVILGVAALATLHARLRPRRMPLAMAVTAVAQIGCGIVSGIAGPGVPAPATIGFAAMWLASAALFAVAGQRSRRL